MFGIQIDRQYCLISDCAKSWDRGWFYRNWGEIGPSKEQNFPNNTTEAGGDREPCSASWKRVARRFLFRATAEGKTSQANRKDHEKCPTVEESRVGCMDMSCSSRELLSFLQLQWLTQGGSVSLLLARKKLSVCSLADDPARASGLRGQGTGAL